MSDYSVGLFWALLIGFFIFLHIFHSINDKRNEKRRKAKIIKNTPIVKSICDGLIKKAVDKYPNIPFDFKPECNYVELVSNYTYSTDTPLREVAGKILARIAPNMAELYKEYKPDFIERETSSPESSKPQIILNLPRNWTERRKAVFERDNGKCRRCGTKVVVERCHIHHIVMKSKGGSHSLDNLVTLCRDCHTLMSEHGMMQSIKPYYVSNSGLVHTQDCYHAPSGELVWGTLPQILSAQAIGTCEKCKPWNYHNRAEIEWKPEIERFLQKELTKMLSNL